ncbi:CHAP domain-containing protein [Bifidobacterium bohemicum]|uniref:CHAP domain protein n=1 Tax=Bifidobacterium bohemicum DSM 22767 TaxID=1437606 RepID=A0A086ZGP8_9BIFI|nr:CHAP domain-containing protein [Bifidobacterium bohemicum]KFI45698.1 CHAP domain protein [Bifidobacterium bohemicum DSM 22767]SCC07336.1 CHAP domain-containing protein [Bifidobacterium bohemicum]
MSRPAHKAPFGAKRRSNRATAPRAVHSVRAVGKIQAEAADGAVVGLSSAVIDKINEVAPPTRRALRLEREGQTRRRYAVASVSLAALVATTTLSMTNSNGRTSLASERTVTTSTTLTPSAGTAASRSESRARLNDGPSDGGVVRDEGRWSLGGANSALDVNKMSKSLANNPHVAEFMDMDAQSLPQGFDPNHPTGDVGNAYEFSQCTWWAYTRRVQLGLPVGSHMGNGADWGATARKLGYWVDNVPRHTGDILVFAPGQNGAHPEYGHVAIIEKINPDGSIVTSECGDVCHGKTYSKTYTAAQAAEHEIIHY